MTTRSDIVVEANGERLAGWLYQPGEDGTHPLIVMSHGFSAIMAMGLDDYAACFADAGFAVLVYDHRNYGASSGWPRHETDPWQQVEDMRAVISYGRNLAFVDPERIGLWGTSYSGGHVLTVGALDSRVKCVVSQVPLVSGQRTFEAWVPEKSRPRFLERLAADRDGRAGGQPPGVTPAAIPGSETAEWAEAVDKDGTYGNEITIRSLDLLRGYEPISFMTRIAPTPLLMIVADQDTQTPVAWQGEAFEMAGHPKKLVTLSGRHYDPYTLLLEESRQAALDWFQEHLK
ncbi:MAG: alpha/beta hydrolase [Rhodospirillaceae bacterium]|nr:alpha/beta hydrolase [Rhodospirillaceae bacterium]MBT4041946.1 alpha/beta hydrolase [Rhodospirillaceae bacterium]MBT4690199.1 alpha/beta hydrolase [Rhodospirillaceae bacterium]MBT5080764.1 alpha/beta hydrolase [Rhodospirillaceae bacterium]MBT5525186.1 alpha/beta hydrolase [Rhodospirillaceae bacterium]